MNQETTESTSVTSATHITHQANAANLPALLRWVGRNVLRAALAIAVVAASLALLGWGQRNGWFAEEDAGTNTIASDSGQASGKRYICPMMCTPPSNEPGRCPVCGMELVEATGGTGGDGISVTIEPAARRLIGIQTAVAKFSEVSRTIETIGTIDFDQSRQSTISAYVDGRLEEMYANYDGVVVAEGDDLALLYSPRLYSAQSEFVASLSSVGTTGRLQIDNGELAAMARDNLMELGMTEEQVAALETSKKPMSRVRIKSPQDGTVIEKSVVEGDYVKAGDPLFKIADLSSVWLMLDLFPGDAAAVWFGQQVEAEIQSVPGEVFTGRVAFISPTVDRISRTVQVRVEVLNFDRKLRPGDYATARITVPASPRDEVYDPALANKFISPMHPQVIRDTAGDCPLCGMALVPTSTLGFASEPLPDRKAITVPRDAVLLAGGRSVVYVETDPGRFEIRRVTLGAMDRTDAVIAGGLAVGETVANRGNFLIDSQMQLAGNPSLLDPSRAQAFPPGPIPLINADPIVADSDSGEKIDRAYDAYFEIQEALAADESAPPLVLNALVQNLRELELAADVADEAQEQYAIARRAAMRMSEPLDTARQAYRSVSHAMLRAGRIALGPRTSAGYLHMYCPMVPGGGGDWMQRQEPLRNPYWGSAMLECGEVVARQPGNAEVGQ